MPDEIDPAAPPADGGPAWFPPAQPAMRSSRRSVVLAVSALVTAVLLGVLVVAPAPYAVDSPGPTKDVLGTDNGTPLITIKGAQTYDPTGQLRLVTVSGTGGPGFPSTVLTVLRGWISRWSVVLPREDLYPEGKSQDEIDQTNQQQMTTSQEDATVAALTELGYAVPATLTVAGTVQGSGADGKLQKGDVITAIDGKAVPTYQDLADVLAAVKPGATITVTVKRGGSSVEVPVVTGKRPDGSAQIGIYIDPTFHPPIDVKISIDNIGGPSAGTMFALGIIDMLTPADEAKGQVIAGTGTISITGDVGPIGGIRQKMAGAVRDGARWFLAPDSNCNEVVGHVPRGLHVAKVSTLHGAREAVAAIGEGKGETLPTCS
ncbi:YlbL family protein [Cellulomonas alba]|uniref:PDZ domain-containing protein n=1 Tax=Cellulomonas alba TaxID=3053467 RepID=A0ABT7SDD4_9CELL|nr:PDZ domain-containing protein [Cellulomonas alba]MDM7854180.1 PDZ domain-containing protein [Cellulomonas alba]